MYTSGSTGLPKVRSFWDTCSSSNIWITKLSTQYFIL
jgi:acyl-coenzyme A synthetase/AMP-(fatty) acid ligase